MAAWRLRPAGKPGRRAAGQLAVLFAEAIVVAIILLRNPFTQATTECTVFCAAADRVLGTLAVVGWPVAAVGALIGAALERRRSRATS